ncbi:MAG: hypothetical protein L0Z53_07100 [Acidobacteriales bacterium]|nr:hypothetical protein [Terriglobales bacterium]
MTKCVNSFLQGLVVAAIVAFWFERQRRARYVAGIRSDEVLRDTATEPMNVAG